MSDEIPFVVDDGATYRVIRGIFGRFKTTKSYPLNYILASLPYDNINLLTTAGEAIDISDSDVTFDQIVQRDVDFERVSKMTKEYLQESENKVLFFPPLLASLVGFESGKAVKKFDKVDRKIEGSTLKQRWENGFFELNLPIANTDTGHRFELKGVNHYFHNFGSVLRYNETKVKLVVIDGQHRLEALRGLKKTGAVDTIEVPICIVFPPDAVSGGQEEITSDLRELFLTVNQQQQKVSGHFLTLLDDQKLSAEAVRQLGDAWKQDLSPLGYTPLHLMEWNQRKERLEKQVTRRYSITTVSIIADTLRKFLFVNATDDDGALVSILNLSEVKADLEQIEDAKLIDEISDNNYQSSQFPILQKQIRAKVVPALTVLFREFEPFRIQDKKLQAGFEWLNSQIEKNVSGFETFRMDVIGKFRSTVDFDQASVRDASVAFEAETNKDESGFNKYYYYLVFQQAYIRCWIDLSRWFVRLGVTPVQIAKAYVAALDVGLCPKFSLLIAPDATYARRTLFVGERVLVNDKAKDNWTSLVGATLASKESALAFASNLADAGVDGANVTEAMGYLEHYAHSSARELLDRLEKVTHEDLAKNYFERDLTDDVIGRLRKLDRENTVESNQAFEKEIAEIVAKRKQLGTEELAAALRVDAKVLLKKGD